MMKRSRSRRKRTRRESKRSSSRRRSKQNLLQKIAMNVLEEWQKRLDEENRKTDKPKQLETTARKFEEEISQIKAARQINKRTLKNNVKRIKDLLKGKNKQRRSRRSSRVDYRRSAPGRLGPGRGVGWYYGKRKTPTPRSRFKERITI